MNRAMLLDHLEMAKRHVGQGEAHVAKQRQIVAALQRDGHDTTEAVRLLATFEDLQRMHEAHLERILDELERLGDSPGSAS